MQIALHSIRNATIVIIKAISLLYTGNLSHIGDLITLTDLVLKAGQEDQVPEYPLDGTIDLRAEEDSPMEAPALAGTAVTVGAPHKTATTEGHPDEPDVAQHHSRYKVSHLTSSPNLSQVDEGQLYPDRAPDGYKTIPYKLATSHETRLQIIKGQGQSRGRSKYPSPQQI